MSLTALPSQATLSLSFLSSLLLFIGLVSCSGSGSDSSPPPIADTGTPGAEEALGERLFLETRFAQAFKVFLDNGGSLNDPNAGDVVVDTIETVGVPINPAPFKGLSINCRACHLVDDTLSSSGGGMRTYADFARRSPIPARADGKTHAPRNSPALVNSTLNRPDGILFPFDAEFSSIEDLIVATLTGRNFGWLPGEKPQAVAHIANIVRGDDGSFDLTETGLSYRTLFTGTNPNIPEELRLPPQFRAFIGSGTDQDIFDAVVRVVAAYVNGLRFSQTTEDGKAIRSPFDVFLEANGFPQAPDSNQTPLDYSRHLLQLVKTREAEGTLKFVVSNPSRTDGQFQFHTQPFLFGTKELAGLKMFLAEPATLPASAVELASGKITTVSLATQLPTSPISRRTIPARPRENMMRFPVMGTALL